MAEQKYLVSIVGTAPFLMHRYTSGMVSQKKRKEKSSDGSIDYSGEWKNTVYTGLSNKDSVVLPAHVLQASLRQAGSQIKSGRGSMKSSAVTDIIFDGLEFPIFVGKKQVTVQDIEDNDWLHTVGAVVQRQRVDRVRAYVPGPSDSPDNPAWTAQIPITSELAKDDIMRLFETAGRRCGIGDWRPNSPKPGSFGRFDVVSIDEVVS